MTGLADHAAGLEQLPRLDHAMRGVEDGRDLVERVDEREGTRGFELVAQCGDQCQRERREVRDRAGDVADDEEFGLAASWSAVVEVDRHATGGERSSDRVTHVDATFRDRTPAAPEPGCESASERADRRPHGLQLCVAGVPEIDLLGITRCPDEVGVLGERRIGETEPDLVEEVGLEPVDPLVQRRPIEYSTCRVCAFHGCGEQPGEVDRPQRSAQVIALAPGRFVQAGVAVDGRRHEFG